MSDKKSTHKVEVVPVKLEPHPNADTLSIVRIWNYTVIVKTDDWKGIDKGAYIVPDSVVDTSRPEFEFLGKHSRITTRRFKGIYSQGLLVPAPKNSKIGDDVSNKLGVTRYVPKINSGKKGFKGGNFEKGPYGHIHQKYDLDSAHRYAQEVMIKGEPIIVREKVHGANTKYLYKDGRFWVASRSGFRQGPQQQTYPNMWWQALYNHPELMEFLKNNPGVEVYGEVYGQVQDLKYGLSNDVRIAIFDIKKNNEWMNSKDAMEFGKTLAWAPLIKETRWSNEIFDLADGPSLIKTANHLREGIVVEPINTRYHEKVGRVKLKIVSNKYLEKSK